MAVDLDRLIRLAKAASPGNWHLDPMYPGWIFADGKHYIATTHRGRESLIVPNSEYIAYASPERIMELVEMTQRWGMWKITDAPVA